MANALGTTNSGRFVQSSFGKPGNFELAVLEGVTPDGTLVHWWRDNTASSPMPWNRGSVISSFGSGSIIQSTFGIDPGNFEVLVLQTTHVMHYYRDNSDVSNPWTVGGIVSSAATSTPPFIQGTFVGRSGAPGNFEAVILEGSNLVHYWRDNSVDGYPWFKSGPITKQSTGPG